MDVIFELARGRPFSIEIGFFDTVLEIKEKIQKYQGIPVAKQTLIFNGQVLQDERDVEYCEILQNSRIQLLIAPDLDKPIVKAEETSPPMKIQLILRMPMSKLPVPVEMDMNEPVVRLKEKIYEMERVPVIRLLLYSNGNELQDHQALRDCELFDNSEIEVVMKTSHAANPPLQGGNISSKKLKIMVLTKCGTKKIPMEVNASDNVGELRKELQKLQQRLDFDLPPEGYFFIYRQNVMEDNRSFRWHHVSNGDNIEIFNGSVTGGS